MESNKKNIVKGYKQTPIGPIPNDWLVEELRAIANYKSSSLSFSSLENNNEGNYPLYGAGGFIKKINFYEQENKYIAIIKDGAGVGRIIICEPKSSALGTMSYISPNEKVDFDFLYFTLQKINFEKYIIGSTIPHIYFKDYSTEKVPLPPLQEQKKIGKILSEWDHLIIKNQSLLKQFQIRRKWLSYILFNHSKIKLHPLTFILDRIKNSFQPDPETLYHQIGIRSHTKGIFYKEGVTGKELGNKSVFWIESDCFIVNIVFAWEHAIAKTTEAEVGMIASHRFPMYKPKKELLNLDYLLYFFKTSKGKDLLELASPGGAGRNKTLGQSEFLKLKIPVPSLKDQEKIVKILSAADNEIELQFQKIQALKVQKKGVMQKLLTGQVRVK